MPLYTTPLLRPKYSQKKTHSGFICGRNEEVRRGAVVQDSMLEHGIKAGVHRIPGDPS